jgi:hypothetical protein
MKAQNASGHDQSGSHKDVSADPKFNTQNKHSDAGMKSQDHQNHDKSSTHKDSAADMKGSAHSDAGMKSQNASARDQSGSHKGVSEAKSQSGSELKKATT